MSEQGRSTLATGEDGRILDRLAGLEKVISPELVRQVLQASGRVNGRACKLTHEVTIWIVLAMGLLTHMPIRQVFRHSRRLRAGEKCPARSSLCTARQRLGLEPVRALHAAVVRPLATPDTPGGFYRRWRLMAFDGTVLDVPDSAANAGFGRSCGARGEAAFPQVRKTSLVELGTHIETALASGGWHDDDRARWPARCGTRFPTTQRTGHAETHRLITNLLDEAEAPARELIVLYHERWEEELVFDEQKTHQDPRRAEKPAQLRSETPEGVKQELYALSLAHFVIRALMFEAARPAKLDVDRLSFVGCFRILQCRLPECDSRTPASLQHWYQALLAELRSEQIGPRRNRIHPRVIKRKMSQWNKKQPHHRRPPPLLKTFEQCIVMKT